jgi:hypothetical protein
MFVYDDGEYGLAYDLPDGATVRILIIVIR